MIGDAAGATMQREARSVPAMAPARLFGPIGRDGRAAGGLQSGRRSSKGCVCVPCEGGRESACGGRLVSVATWPSVVRMSAECISVARAGVISLGVTHTAAWLESQTCSSRNAHGSKVGRVKRARSLTVRSVRPERKRAHARRRGCCTNRRPHSIITIVVGSGSRPYQPRFWNTMITETWWNGAQGC